MRKSTETTSTRKKWRPHQSFKKSRRHPISVCVRWCGFVLLGLVLVHCQAGVGGQGWDCGDGRCSGIETCGNCPADCGACPAKPTATCGDGQCSDGEDCSSCAKDCGACPIKPRPRPTPTETCGDGVCASGENCSSCPKDCGTCPPAPGCGDGQCGDGEDCSSCPKDCGACPTKPTCGDNKCDQGEDCRGCPDDCGACPKTPRCGDNTCHKEDGESCQSCPQDCGPCQPPSSCGDGTCDKGETCHDCESDCGKCEPKAICGDATCSPGEDCSSCAKDCGACPSSNFKIPLHLTEVAGVARINDPVSSGIPLPKGLLQDATGVQVVDGAGKPIPAQFQVLERWRESDGVRTIKWLLITFLANVGASGKATYFLQPGQNPQPSQPVTVSEVSGAYVLNGTTIKKDLSAPFAFVLTKPDGTSTVAADALKSLQWSVSTKGPIKSCIKAESDTEPGRFGLMLWLCGYTGLRRIDMTVVLKNTARASQGPLYFKDFSIQWQVQGSQYEIGGDPGKSTKGTLSSGESAYIYQDSSGTTRWDQVGEYNQYGGGFVLPYDTKASLGKPSFRGYRIYQKGRAVGSGDHASGWLKLGKAGLAVRHFWQQYPKALEVAPQQMIVRLWPKYWKAHGGVHWLDDLQRKAHDITFRLDGITAQDTIAYNHPLVIHTGLAWIRQSQAAGYFSSKFKESKPDAARLGRFEYGWVAFGGSYVDRIRRRYHEEPNFTFLSTADPYAAYRMWLLMRHTATITPIWPDQFSYPKDKGILSHNCYGCPLRDKGTYTSNSSHHGYMPWNVQHWAAAELYDGWRLFGDPLALDAIKRSMTQLQFFVDARDANAPTAQPRESRWDGLPMVNLVEAFRITGDPSYLKTMAKYAALIARITDPVRGYYIPAKVLFPPLGGDKPFMISNVVGGLKGYYELTGDGRTFDTAMGLIDYAVREGYLTGCLGFLYTTPIDEKLLAQERSKALATPTAKCQAAQGIRVWQMFKRLAWAWQETGRALYKKTFDDLYQGIIVRTNNAVTEYKNTTADSQSQWNQRCDQVLEQPKQDTTPPAAITDLKAQVSAGQVQLTWKVPKDAVRYHLKRAPSLMVEDVNVQKSQRTTHTNWWAAQHLSAPAPAQAGALQSHRVSGLAKGKHCFAIRAFDAARNRAAISNVACVTMP